MRSVSDRDDEHPEGRASGARAPAVVVQQQPAEDRDEDEPQDGERVRDVPGAGAVAARPGSPASIPRGRGRWPPLGQRSGGPGGGLRATRLRDQVDPDRVDHAPATTRARPTAAAPASARTQADPVDLRTLVRGAAHGHVGSSVVVPPRRAPRRRSPTRSSARWAVSSSTSRSPARRARRRPRRAACRRGPRPRCRPRRSSRTRPTTSSRAAVRNCSSSATSASVSPGNPTMTLVRMPASGAGARTWLDQLEEGLGAAEAAHPPQQRRRRRAGRTGRSTGTTPGVVAIASSSAGPHLGGLEVARPAPGRRPRPRPARAAASRAARRSPRSLP